MAASWESIAKRKQAERAALIPAAWRLKNPPAETVLDVMSIPHTCGILTPAELGITEKYDATALAAAIRSKKLTSIAVTTAYCKRAAVAQQLTNCLTEILFDSALKRAAFLDNHLARHGTPVGPLHGVPVSIKDSFKVAGFDACVGMTALCYQPAAANSHLVDLLLSAGAVIYCKTNVPQGMATLDSMNQVFGRVLNPRNRLLTAGGSTGGEGALLALGGSPLGVGTDIGGSIRVPAMCNGIYGVKPSAHRVPWSGQASTGQPGSTVAGLLASAGPMARSLRDCDLFMRTVADARPWTVDPTVIPGAWDTLDLRANPSPPKLTIGILHTDNVVTPLPPIAALLNEVSRTLAAHPSINVVHIPAPAALGRAQTLANRLMSFEGGNTMFDLMEATGEPLTPWLAGKMQRRKPATLADMQKVHAQREALCAELATALWRTPAGAEVDAIICPVAPHPTPKHDAWVGIGYTIDWVMTDYAAGVLPVRDLTEADLAADIPDEQKRYPRNLWDKTTQDLWPDGREARKHYLGGVLCVQVLAPRLQERRLLRCMEAIDGVLKGGDKSKGGSKL